MRSQVHLTKERREGERDVLDRYSPFDRTERVPICVRKHGNRSSLPFQRRRNCLPEEAEREVHNEPNHSSEGGDQAPTLYGVVGFERLKIWTCRPAVPSTSTSFFTSIA